MLDGLFRRVRSLGPAHSGARGGARERLGPRSPRERVRADAREWRVRQRPSRRHGRRSRPLSVRASPSRSPSTRALGSHSSEHTEFSRFAGKEVAVVGAGASAVEAAALVLEAGGKPLLLVRSDEVVFHTRMGLDRPLLERLRKDPNSVLGPGRKSWVLEKLPDAPALRPRGAPRALHARLPRSRWPLVAEGSLLREGGLPPARRSRSRGGSRRQGRR